jgi:hypothetical protein
MKLIYNTLQIPKKIFHIFFLGILVLEVLQSCNAVKQADRAADRDAARNTVNTYFPVITFDENAAKLATAEGKSSIKGVLFTKEKTKVSLLTIKSPLTPKIYGENRAVILYPVTAYFEDWYKMRSEKENKNTRVYMTDKALFYTIVTRTDSYGRFSFDKMKPGKYFLQSFMTINIAHNATVYTGSDTYSNGDRVNYYENEKYYTQQDERIEKFVEINTDGEIVEVKLK